MCCKDSIATNTVTPEMRLAMLKVIPTEQFCCIARVMYDLANASFHKFRGDPRISWQELSDDERQTLTEKMRRLALGEFSPSGEFEELMVAFYGITASTK
jgi:hypothetical protein